MCHTVIVIAKRFQLDDVSVCCKCYSIGWCSGVSSIERVFKMPLGALLFSDGAMQLSLDTHFRRWVTLTLAFAKT